MKALFIIHDPGEGGVWTVTEMLCRYFMKVGVDFRLVILSHEPLRPRAEKAPFPVFAMASVMQLGAFIKDYNPDILLPSDLRVCIKIMPLSIIYRKPVIACDHTGYLAHRIYDWQYAGNLRTWSAISKKLAAGLFCLKMIGCYQAYHFTAHVVSPSLSNKRLIEKYCLLPQGKIIHIDNPVIDTTQAQSPVQENQQTIPTFLNIGRIVPYKGHDILLKAFAIVRRRMDAKLIILGESSVGEGNVAAVKQLISDLHLGESVELPGAVCDVSSYIRGATACVLASRYEVLSTVLIEALYEGVAVIATDCNSGPAEILENGVYGQLIPVDDVEALAEAMINAASGNAVSSPENRQRRAKHYAIDRAGEQYIGLMKSCLRA